MLLSGTSQGLGLRESMSENHFSVIIIIIVIITRNVIVDMHSSSTSHLSFHNHLNHYRHHSQRHLGDHPSRTTIIHAQYEHSATVAIIFVCVVELTSSI